MRLIQFRVTNFRSVDDSGWIEASDVTALIGTNESGKTNLLLPLWKLSPAGPEGAIDLLADAPRKRYNEIRSGDQTEVFVEALFEVDEALQVELAKLSGSDAKSLKTVNVKRRFDGVYLITFPDDVPLREHPPERVRDTLARAISDVEQLTALRSEDELKSHILITLQECKHSLGAEDMVTAGSLDEIKSRLAPLDPKNGAKTSTLVPRLAQLLASLDDFKAQISRTPAHSNASARQLIVKRLPKFVYYSNYGNLDSEIYLPHVIENMSREGLGAKEAAKVRTLKVLFNFVRLSASEVLELGRDFRSNPSRQPTDVEVADIARKKKERDVLLQSASTELTSHFKDWWKQGAYRFRFQADGDHFRIWVSDDKRPEDIELEGRSTGLQWFLSFYLIFLVESEDAHSDAILLLDEPGLSLHPLAQRDLSLFFENLATSNQILYTTHSPFLVDPNHLDRVKAVYVQSDGTTAVSSDLRAGEKQQAQSRSIYPVYAALGISVSDILLVGADSIIVEGISDQFYLSTIKTILIGLGEITPSRELVFIPAGGTKGIKAVAAIVCGKDERLPRVLLDADSTGRKVAQELKTSVYATDQDRITLLSSVMSLPDAEIEDLIPASIMLPAIDRIFRGSEEDFANHHHSKQPLLGQIETFALAQHVQLPEGWKVDLAKAVKARLLKQDPNSIDRSVISIWKQLFGLIAP